MDSGRARFPSLCCVTVGKCLDLWKPREVWGGAVETRLETIFSVEVSYKLSLLLFCWKLKWENGRGGGKGSGAEAGSVWPWQGWFTTSKPPKGIFSKVGCQEP